MAVAVAVAEAVAEAVAVAVAGAVRSFAFSPVKEFGRRAKFGG